MINEDEIKQFFRNGEIPKPQEEVREIGEDEEIEEHTWEDGKYAGIAMQDAKAGDILTVNMNDNFIVSGC